jgi:hypothetical protein
VTTSDLRIWTLRRGSGTRLGAVWLLACLLGSCGSGFDFSREPNAVGGPPVMRRLTQSQYRATIAEIFGPEIPIVARFEPGLRDEGLIAIGTSRSGISPFSVEQYHSAALSIAAAVLSAEHRDRYLPCKPQPDDKSFDAACAKCFIEQYGLLLFRRPLTDADTRRLIDSARSGQQRLGDFYTGLQFALVGMLVSPEFLLRIENSRPDGKHSDRIQLDAWSKATRVSYFLTNATPDKELLRAAAAGELNDKQGLTRQVERMIASPHFEDAVRAFFEDMLQFDKFDGLAKDSVVYPAFTTTAALDAQEQTLRTITDLLIRQHGDYRDIFTTRHTFLTRALGTVYRLPVPTRNGWESDEFPSSSHRAGIQSQVAFLALHSHPGRSSPTLRGKAMREVFLCQEVPDPPPNVNFDVVQDSSNAKTPTARDRLSAHRTQPACAGCHKIMDPLGLTLENFDGAGIYRVRENGAQIDASGSLDGNNFTTSEGLARALHDHPETPRCLVEKMYRFAVGRDTEMEERPYMDHLIYSFKAAGYRLPELMRTIALSDNFSTIAAPVETDPEDQAVASQALKGGRS